MVIITNVPVNFDIFHPPHGKHPKPAQAAAPCLIAMPVSIRLNRVYHSIAILGNIQIGSPSHANILREASTRDTAVFNF